MCTEVVGKNAVIRDDWTAQKDDHRVLDFTWTGDTTFRVELDKLAAPIQQSANMAGTSDDFSSKRLLIEFCCSENSALGQDGPNTKGCEIMRLTEEVVDLQ